MVQTIHLAHMPPDQVVYATIFKNVQNTAFLKQQLLVGNKEFEYAFVDAAMVISPTHILSSTFRACNDNLKTRLKSHNIHSEIVFCLSSTNNIGEAFRKFGIGDVTQHLVVIKIGSSSDEKEKDAVSAFLKENVQGEEIEFNEENLKELRDLSRIRKGYKLGNSGNNTARGASGTKRGKKERSTGTNEDNIFHTDPNNNGGDDSNIGDPVTIDEAKELEVQILGLMALRGSA